MVTPRDSWSRLQSLLVELRQRRVYRVAAVYAAAAFVAWQLAEIAVPALHLPDWVLTLVVAGSIAGLPVVIVLAWAFDITPAGVKRAEPPAPGLLPGRGRLLIAAILLSLFGAGAYVGFGMYQSRAGELPPIRSLAVLPLENLSGDPEQAYFTEGMTEALTAELAAIPELRVISRTSAMHYAGSGRPLPTIAAELGVDGLIEGSVMHAENEVRITLQLIHGAADRHLWSRSYRRTLSDILSLQAEVARAIAEEVGAAVTPAARARLTGARSVDPEAHRLWLKGNYQLTRMNEASFQNAIEAFEGAITVDPGYAQAHAGLALANEALGEWFSSGRPGEFVPRARAAAERALALDSTVAEAHVALARIRQLYEWDWDGAYEAYNRGIKLNPSAAVARLMYANFLTSMGRFEEAIRQGRETIEIDPLTPSAWNELGWAYQHAGRHEEALAVYGESLELVPDFPQTHLLLSMTYLELDDHEAAAEHARRALGPSGPESLSPNVVGWAGSLLARGGQTDQAREMLDGLTERAEREHVPSSALAEIHAGLRENERALDLFEQAVAERDPSIVWLNVGRQYEPLRQNPRFNALLRRMGFPDT